MSREIKYIGMDVHKEAIVIAVLNGSGKLVMESIVETKASSILQFIQGLRGELHVTWEEGTWAAWLPGRESATLSSDKSAEGDRTSDSFSRGKLSGVFDVPFLRPQATLQSRLCAGCGALPRVMGHISRGGMGWCFPRPPGLPPSLSGIGTEEEGQAQR
jgi:hypothetical protein